MANLARGLDDILFGDQKDCDGVVFDGKGWGLFAEHVFLPRREAQDEASLESLILKAVEHKARKGVALCQGQDAHHGQMVPQSSDAADRRQAPLRCGAGDAPGEADGAGRYQYVVEGWIYQRAMRPCGPWTSRPTSRAGSCSEIVEA